MPKRARNKFLTLMTIETNDPCIYRAEMAFHIVVHTFYYAKL